ncbi:hypothetical protein XENTR_v10015636 [Xenopus tropicalis]|nr:hypothetical protein XENTR_v10015636 [Xenopus tropicalis]
MENIIFFFILEAYILLQNWNYTNIRPYFESLGCTEKKFKNCLAEEVPPLLAVKGLMQFAGLSSPLVSVIDCFICYSVCPMYVTHLLYSAAEYVGAL